MEETVLTYLSDNIGSDEAFTPMCVYLESYAYSQSSCKKESTLAVEFEVTFVQKMNKVDKNKEQCSDIQTALCCSQLAINSSAERLDDPKETSAGLFCDNLGCNFKEKCGNGRMSTHKDGGRFLKDVSFPGMIIPNDRILRKHDKGDTNIVGGGGRKDCSPYFYPNANPTWFDNYKGRGVDANNEDMYHCPAYGILKSQDFNEALHCITKLNPQDSSNYADAYHGSTVGRIKSAPVYAQLNIHNIESAAYCSMNRYNLQQQRPPVLTCDEFENEYECQASKEGNNSDGTNDDILPFVDKITKDGDVCLDPEDL
jgi:hypothetical protein